MADVRSVWLVSTIQTNMSVRDHPAFHKGKILSYIYEASVNINSWYVFFELNYIE